MNYFTLVVILIVLLPVVSIVGFYLYSDYHQDLCIENNQIQEDIFTCRDLTEDEELERRRVHSGLSS